MILIQDFHLSERIFYIVVLVFLYNLYTSLLWLLPVFPTISHTCKMQWRFETMTAFVSAHNSYSLTLVMLSVNQSSDKERATAAAHTPGAKMRDSAWLSPPPVPLLWLQPSSLPSKPTPVSVSEALERWKGICNAPPLTANCAVLLEEVYWPCLRFKHTRSHQPAVNKDDVRLAGRRHKIPADYLLCLNTLQRGRHRFYSQARLSVCSL